MDGALILAGGASTRMGQDKAWLDLDGRTLLEHVVEIVAARCRPIVVCARPGQVLPSLAIEHERVDDPLPGQGPLVGIVAGLARLAARGAARAYLGSCDAAALSEAHVAFMLERLACAPESTIAAVPIDADGRTHPLAAAVVVAPLLERAAAQLRGDQLRLQALLRGPGIVQVDVRELPDPDVLHPCNTPAQWQALRARIKPRAR